MFHFPQETMLFCGVFLEKRKQIRAGVVNDIGHVVAEFYANHPSMHGRRQFVVSNATL
jgi:hypothetical protein